ncbi:UPF0481 protein At3g47200-like [Rutidosis leptorrhynchoides]|uniref:UPF0481 protein At3g47200-like n=1 Tax=Rutidosis leptorrhynchoides TaxID=125765 RepID=UPI003A99D6BD
MRRPYVLPLKFPRVSDTITNETELTSSKSNVDRNSLKILLDFLERGRKRCTQNPPTISVVPSVLKDFSPPRSFSPMTVSIGPLHKDDENTKEFERVKLCYLHDLLQRNINSRPDQILKECVEKVNGSMDQIRASYADIIPFSDIDLANMMVMDACFILEFCLKHDDEENFDNILDGTLRDSIAIDLILIENQIPFFVLEDIFNCTCRISASTPPLTKLLQFILVPYVDPFQYYITNKEFPNTDIVNESTHDHVLGYLHKCYKRVGNNMQSNRTVRSEPTTLKEVAMKIKSYLIACFSWFQGKPTNLLVPTLNIYIPTGQILRNLIVYEQCFPKVHNYFTSYAIAMRKIVEDEDDVATLVELNVLVNNLNSNKEAANMLQTLSNTCTIIDFSSYQELMQLKNYFDSSWIRNLRRLRSTYFGSPWSAIAFVAGIILFSLTIVQTVQTILCVIWSRYVVLFINLQCLD